MGKRAVLVPAGVLAGVLALTGGIAVVAHGSSGGPIGRAVVPTPSVSSSSATGSALPPQLVAAVRATLAHRSLELTQELGGSDSSERPGPALRGVLDVTSGNYRLGGAEDADGRVPFEFRFVDGVVYVRGDSVGDVDEEGGIDGGVVRTGPTKPWTGMRGGPALTGASDPILPLRQLSTGDRRWSLTTDQRLPEADRWTLTNSGATIGEATQIDLDVHGGEVTRLTVRSHLPELPECPNVPKDVLAKQDEAATGETVLVHGSEQQVRVTAPPPDQVDMIPAADLPTELPTPPSLSCSDLPTALSTEMPSGPPVGLPSEGPQGWSTYSGPAVPAPLPAG